MSRALLWVAVAASVVHGLPIVPPVEISDTCDTISGCRTLQSIIFTCVGTIYLCAWVSLHIDVPNPRVPWILRPVSRWLTFLVMVITPELWAHLAFQQMLGARNWVEYQKEKNVTWNMRHGFLAVMGGFAMRTGPQTVERLTSGQLRALQDDRKIVIPEIPSDDIEDRSKTTALAKTVVLFQTGWFVVQLIARRVYGLPIIPLEVFTLAFSLVTLALYICNWYKPYSMRTPFLVEIVTDGVFEDTAKLDTKKDAKLDAEELQQNAMLDVEELVLGNREEDDKQEAAERCGEHQAVTAVMLLSEPRYGRQYKELPRIFRLKCLKPLRDMGYSISDYLGLFDPHHLWYHTHPKLGMRLLSALLVVLVCTVFGAIHFLGWYLNFPSALCLEIWQICTIASIGIPLLALISIALFARVHPDTIILNEMRMIIDTTLVLAYGACRIILLLLTIWSILSVPSGAYKSIEWTSYAPHI